MRQLLGISRKKLKRENMEEFFGASLLYGDSNNRMLDEEGDWILLRCEVCGKFLSGPVPLLYTGFPGVRACIRAC